MEIRRTARPGKRILVLASTYPRWAGDHEPGFVHELARRLTHRFDVLVLAPHAPGAKARETLDGVDVHRYRYGPACLETLVNDGGVVANLRRSRWKYLLVPGFVLGQAWQAWRLIRRYRVDVVHAHWLLPQGLIAAVLQFLPGGKVPFMVTSHGADLYALNGSWMGVAKAFVARRAAVASVVSHAMRERLHALGVPSSAIAVLPMGVDLLATFAPAASPARSEREILFVGRLVEKKGLRHLLDAMPSVLSRMPDASLSIVGFGPEESALKARVAELGLETRVRFHGAVRQSELPRLYQRAALFVAPFIQAGSGDQEGLGLVLVEALGCGCPVLAGDVPAVRDVLGGAPDHLVDPRNQEALVAAITRVLLNPATARRNALDIRARLVDQFDWDRVASGYGERLARCAAQEPRQGR